MGDRAASPAGREPESPRLSAKEEAKNAPTRHRSPCDDPSRLELHDLVATSVRQSVELHTHHEELAQGELIRTFGAVDHRSRTVEVSVT